jgi:hypothetical protein
MPGERRCGVTVTVAKTPVRETPAAIRIIEGLLLFLGLTAMAGGVAMTVGMGEVMLPEEWLEAIPLIDSWLVPGLVLGIGFGVGSLVVFYGMVRRPAWPWVARLTGHHWSWIATLALGVGHLVWIGLELVFLPSFSALQVVYGLVGMALLLLPLSSSARHDLTAPGR